MADREKVALEKLYTAGWQDANAGRGSNRDKAVNAALSAMQGNGWRQEVHTALLNAAHELRATAPFIGGSGQVDMLAVADRCLALTLPELPAPPSAPGDEGEGA